MNSTISYLNNVLRRIWFNLRNFFHLLYQSAYEFSNDNALKLSASLSYYTLFSLAPMLIIVIAISSIWFGKEAAEGYLYTQFEDLLGTTGAIQLQEMISNAHFSGNTPLATIIGIATLVLGATGVFLEIQDSINGIWGIKAKPKKNWLKMIQNRFLSFSVIVSLGFLLLVSLAVTAVLDGFSDRLQSIFPDVAQVLFYILNQVVTFIVISTLFGVIFKVLPDAKIKWKDVFVGAMLTAILFMLGKLGISFYISKTEIGSTYGAAGSLAILLVWIYYSSLILYFGAEFTKAYAVKFGSPIHPNSYAVTIKEVEVEMGKNSIQKKEKAPDKIVPSK